MCYEKYGPNTILDIEWTMYLNIDFFIGIYIWIFQHQTNQLDHFQSENNLKKKPTILFSLVKFYEAKTQGQIQRIRYVLATTIISITKYVLVYTYNLQMEILILDHCGAWQNGLDMRISNMYLGGQSE